MSIDFFSFIFGAIIMLALVIVLDKLYATFWGSRKVRSLTKEVRRLRAIIRRKDKLIEKSLKEMNKEEL